MQIISAQGAYVFVLTELEWYAGTAQQQEAWRVQCKREGAEAGARSVTILVNPDAVMSISPNPHRHRVWSHVFPTPAEEAFADALLRLRGTSKLTSAQEAAIARRVFVI